MEAGRLTGCHQRPDRSFCWLGYQFPVCARCTGVLIGNILAWLLYHVVTPPTILSLTFCGLMFLDWFIQHKKIRESTNLRRFITGTLCGYGLVSLILRGLYCLLYV
nr:DUF2085 domain-containing protein [Anaerotruncus colihominis]